MVRQTFRVVNKLHTNIKKVEPTEEKLLYIFSLRAQYQWTIQI